MASWPAAVCLRQLMMAKYFGHVRISLQNTLAYRGPIVVWLISNLLTVVAMIFVWRSASAGGLIGGFTKPELISYYVIGLFFQWFTGWTPFYWLKDEIKSGEIVGTLLVKPISPYWQIFCRELGWHLVATPVGSLATLGVFVFARHSFVVYGLWPVVLALASSVLAIFLIFSFSLCLGLLAFWFTHIGTVDAAFWGGKIFFGGQGIPVAFLSPQLIRVAYILPFRYLFSLPLEIYFAKLSPAQIGQGIVMQCLWIVFFVTLFKFMWHRGTRAYTAFGN